jgi:diguanylate cyclase (GGDEF)-like protein
MFRKWWLEITLSAMVLVTIGALLGESYLLRTKIVITPEDQYAAHVIDDAAIGGNSSARVLDQNGFEWECALREKFPYPFCEMELLLNGSATRGVDLRHFRTMRIWLDYEGAGRSVRVYLRNFDPRYSKVADTSTTKYNQVEIPVEQFANRMVEVSIQDFFVADWWVASQRIPPSLSHPQFENVVIFEVQTGSGNTLGNHRFKLHRVELIGQGISTERWYLIIMMVWLVAVLALLAVRISTLRKEVRLQKTRTLELAEVNKLLDRHSRELEERSKRDLLTGAFNRQGVDEVLQVALGEWRREKKPMSLVLMDIDHFKQINDRFGHTVGDYVLAEVTQVVKGSIRTKDMFARWGGEEFVLVCRNTTIDDAKMAAEKIRMMIAQHIFDHGIKVTASFGVAALHANESLEHLFQIADQGLYRAKSEGRNRVVVIQS